MFNEVSHKKRFTLGKSRPLFSAKTYFSSQRLKICMQRFWERKIIGTFVIVLSNLWNFKDIVLSLSLFNCMMKIVSECLRVPPLECIKNVSKVVKEA